MNKDAFNAAWLNALEERARVIFEVMPLPDMPGNHCQIADAMAAQLDLKVLRDNWELLDAEGAIGEARSALNVIAGALENDMEFPQQAWLGADGAAACAQDFIGLFETPRTFVSNRLEGLWNPLTNARIEWAFVGMDGANAALLLIARD
jgi:hypothetical protein